MIRRRVLVRACVFGALALAVALCAGAGAALAEPRGLERAPESFRAWLDTLPEGQRRAALRRLGDMPTHRRNRLFHRWEAIEEGERRELEQRMLERLGEEEPGPPGLRERPRLDELSPESREKLAPLVRRWRDMGPEERRRMRERLERFRRLTPEEQEAMVEKRFATKSPEERRRVLESLRRASRALPRHPLLDAPEAPPEAPREPPPD